MADLRRADPRTRIEAYRGRIRALSNLLPKGQSISTTDVELGALTGLSENVIRVTRYLLVYIKALDHQGGQGQNGTWKMLMDGDELDKALDLEMERQMRGGLAPETIRKKSSQMRRRPVTRQSAEKVAIATDRIGLPVGAVVGPEAPKPLALDALRGQGSDAATALVMAAKQYRARGGAADAKVQKAQALVADLQSMGVPVPKELQEAATPVPNDRLESIALVLPYVEALERQVAGLGDQLRAMHDYGELKAYRERHKREHEAMVASGVAAAMREQAGR